MIELVDKIRKVIENNEFRAGIFPDWSQASDTVNAGILLKKLQNISGIDRGRKKVNSQEL